MSEYIVQIIDTTLSSFDFGFCCVVNIATFLMIKLLSETKHPAFNGTWIKRGILLFCIFFIGGLYYESGSDLKLLLNSAILAPVSWSWIFKPICKKLGFDYKQVEVIE